MLVRGVWCTCLCQQDRVIMQLVLNHLQSYNVACKKLRLSLANYMYKVCYKRINIKIKSLILIIVTILCIFHLSISFTCVLLKLLLITLLELAATLASFKRCLDRLCPMQMLCVINVVSFSNHRKHVIFHKSILFLHPMQVAVARQLTVSEINSAAFIDILQIYGP